MWYKLANTKILYIMRGPSGAGKSTLAKKLGIDGLTLSTDDFWMKNGKYEFDIKRLGEAHQWNQERAEKYMSQGISPIIIDNTNIEAWEMKPYVLKAREHGYTVKLVPVEIKNTAKELAERNVHNVPEAAIQRMLDKYNPNISEEDILNSERPKIAPKRTP
jgi:predicted kinase